MRFDGTELGNVSVIVCAEDVVETAYDEAHCVVKLAFGAQSVVGVMNSNVSADALVLREA